MDVVTEVITDDEMYLRALLKKAIEETSELAHAETDENLQEEMADVLEVLDAIRNLKRWDINHIESIQKEKREQRGGFDKRLLMLGKPQ